MVIITYFLLYFIEYLDSMINLLFINTGAIKNIMSLVDITFKKYSEEIKIAIKNASQRHYMMTIGRSSKIQDSTTKEKAILARYEL